VNKGKNKMNLYIGGHNCGFTIGKPGY